MLIISRISFQCFATNSSYSFRNWSAVVESRNNNIILEDSIYMKSTCLNVSFWKLLYYIIQLAVLVNNIPSCCDEGDEAFSCLVSRYRSAHVSFVLLCCHYLYLEISTII